MKICIWCQENEQKVSFNRAAHIFPQSLGGKRICKNVCDSCNLYFGSKQSLSPSIEIALKEPLNISRTFILNHWNKISKNIRFKSEYFDYDLKNHIIKPKFKYRLQNDFQYKFTKQFRRGVYKIFLEERSESFGDALDSKFDFIRQFARFGLGDCPVFYCKPRTPAIFISKEDINDPVIRFTEHSDMIMKEFGFYSYFFITHMLTFPTIRTYEITIENYFKYLSKNEGSLYQSITPINYVSDLDFLFSFAR